MDNMMTNTQSALENEDINSLLNSLAMEKMKLVEEARYVEAENIKNKIKEIKDSLEGRNKKAITSQHDTEMRALEEEYNREVMEFQAIWDEKFRNYKEREVKDEANLNGMHDKEMRALYDHLEQTLPKLVTLKHSREYLDLRQVEMKMVKQERYLEAHQVKIKADAIGKEEEEKFNKEKESKVKKKVDKLLKKQFLEKKAIKDKFAVELELMNKTKSNELEKLIAKFKNKKNDLDQQQKQEKILTENTNMMRAKTFSKLNRDKQFSNMNKSKQSFQFDPEIKIKSLKKLSNTRSQQKSDQIILNNADESNLKSNKEYYEEEN